MNPPQKTAIVRAAIVGTAVVATIGIVRAKKNHKQIRPLCELKTAEIFNPQACLDFRDEINRRIVQVSSDLVDADVAAQQSES